MSIKLREKSGHFYAVVRIKENNRSKDKWVSLDLRSDASKKEVKKRLKEVEELFKEECTDDEEILFTQYLQRWVENQKGIVAMSTWEGYCTYAYKHLVPYFQPLKLKLKDLTPAHVQDYYDYKYKQGRMDGKENGLAIESIIKHKSLLMRALDTAVIEELISVNPAKYVKLPAKRSSKRKETFLNAAEAKKMLDALVGTPLYAPILTTLYYGLRKSEMLGLKWESIDFTNDTLTLENTVVKNLTTVEKKTMKTSASHHTYPLMPRVKRVLMEQRAWQNSNRERLGDQYHDSDFVFTWEDGRPFLPDTILRSFQRILKRNHFTPLLRIHDLRHSTASILYEQGYDLKDIQTWLRHADIGVTMNVYTHIKQRKHDEIPDCVQNVFSPTPRTKAKILGKPNSEN